MGFSEVAAGVLVWRCPVLDVNAVLVCGDESAVLVDTLSCPSQARELAGGVRSVTDAPVRVVNTHAHFDHFFGNGVVVEELPVVGVWAHPEVDRVAAGMDEAARAAIVSAYGDLDARFAVELPGMSVSGASVSLTGPVVFDLGGRVVRAWPVGHAHSPGDVVVACDDVLIAGDLLEEGADPQVGDADVAAWVAVLDGLLPSMRGPVVPGHGAVVDAGFAAAQRDVLAGLIG